MTNSEPTKPRLVVWNKPEDVQPELASLQQRAGGGHDGGMPPDGTDAKLARLEADAANTKTILGELRTDFRERTKDLRDDLRDMAKKVDNHFLVGIGALATVGLGLLAVLAKGFHWI